MYRFSQISGFLDTFSDRIFPRRRGRRLFFCKVNLCFYQIKVVQSAKDLGRYLQQLLLWTKTRLRRLGTRSVTLLRVSVLVIPRLKKSDDVRARRQRVGVRGREVVNFGDIFCLP